MPVTGDYSILRRIKEDPNAATVAKVCEAALQEGVISPADLREWEVSPSWIFNCPLAIPASLREHTYRLLINDEQKFVKENMQSLIKQGITVDRLVEAIREYKEIHGGTREETFLSAYRDNPYILGQVLNAQELNALDKVRPKHMKPTSLQRLRAHLASSWRLHRQMGRMTLKPNSDLIHLSAETLASTGEHEKQFYYSLLLDQFTRIVPSKETDDWPYSMRMFLGNDGKPTQAIPNWIYHGQWQAVRALDEHSTRNRHDLPDGWYSWVKTLNLDESQEDALTKMWRLPFTVIVGNPGTGKTRLARALKEATERFGGSVLGCSPTGIAAKRMQQSSGINSETIHRRFGLAHSGSSLGRGSLAFPEQGNRFLIVDEGGMLDLITFHAIMWGTPCEDGVRIIIMGDDNQLPPVGYAQPFSSILNDPNWEPFVARLNVSHRLKGDLTKAIEVFFDSTTELPWGNQLRLWEIPSGEIDEFRTAVLSWIQQVPEGQSWQILTPFRTETSNHLFGSHEVNTWIVQDEDSLGIGRRIVQRENSRTTGLRNGELGYIVRIEGSTRTARFSDDTEVTLPHAEAYREWMPADCLTVHKAQGGEYEHTLVLLPPGSANIDPRNLYTALSRSKVTVTVMGQDVVSLVETIRRNKKQNPPSSFARVLKTIRTSRGPEQIAVQHSAPQVKWDL